MALVLEDGVLVFKDDGEHAADVAVAQKFPSHWRLPAINIESEVEGDGQ